MARKQTQTNRNEMKVWKAAQDVGSNVIDDKEFSEALSSVLDYLAVNEEFIQFKRKRMFSYEHEITLIHKAFGRNRRNYVFGSQIEGTSTIGMMSDVDHVQRFYMFRLFLDSEKPSLQMHDHQVVIKVSTNGCASQYCVLTMIEPSAQARNSKQLDPNPDNYDIVKFFRRDWTTFDGMIPHTIMFDTLNETLSILKKTTRHGPAQSLRNMDAVKACYCKSLPKQCLFVFERPRPGHWPLEETLEKAEKYGVFIIPQGPPKSGNICTYDFNDKQWRISTNLTERSLMFSLNTVHLKAYVMTKMIKKELFVQKYGDRLSSFHFKTALFFAVENTPPDVWREDNLINCVKYILATLKRFLTRRNCPHFTIGNVDLFDGKIERHEFPKLVDKLTYIIHSLRKKIENIQMDSLGKLLREHDTRQNERRKYTITCSTLSNYVFNGITDFLYEFEFSKLPVNFRIALFKKEFSRLDTCCRAILEKYRKYDYSLHCLISVLASLVASTYLELKAEGNEYTNDGITKVRKMCTQSLESDIIGNYMRYASLLFCNGEYDEACKYFDIIEKKIEKDKQSNLIYQLCVSPSDALALQIAKQSYGQTFKQRWSVFLIFTQAEALCVPEFLRCEMYRRGLGKEGSSEILLSFYNNEDCICVQIEPYLYYLQYLTYKLLNQEPNKSEALMKLLKFTEIFKPAIVSSNDVFFLFYFDTSLNMLGHCFELEQKFESAWKTYTTSLQMLPQRNAAVLHIIRLLWSLIQSQRSF